MLCAGGLRGFDGPRAARLCTQVRPLSPGRIFQFPLFSFLDTQKPSLEAQLLDSSPAEHQTAFPEQLRE